MDQQSTFGTGWQDASRPSAAPDRDPGAAGEPVRFVPVIGSGPLRPSNAGPLVPEAALSGAVATLARPEQLTSSGHPVPEFVAGSTQMAQILAAQFPLAQLPEEALGETVGAAQALIQAGQSLLVRATHEATTRGLPGQTGHSVPDWITTWAPHIDRSEALATARVASTITADQGSLHTAPHDPEGNPDHPGTADPDDPAGTHPDGSHADDPHPDGPHSNADESDVAGCLAALGAKITDGTARVSRANIITRFVQEMTPIADPASLVAAATTLTDNVTTLGPRELAIAIRKLKSLLKPPPDDDDDEDEKASRQLFRRIGTVAGLAEWQLLLGDEAEATMQAALDPLMKPRPSADENGMRRLDPRTTAQRRADALMEIITHATTTASTTPGSGPAKVVITTTLGALKGLLPGGGRDEHGHHISPSALRRLACDADLMPLVLGGPSEPLDLGRLKRLYTPGQRQAVYFRDKHCSFPGCTVPAAWTQIHHVVHWAFGGQTDLLNAAALCQRHHTVVHKYGFTATITADDVTWHIPEPHSMTGFT